MAQPPGTLYEIRWSEVCPWLILVRALRVSILVRVLLLAFTGVILTQWGWSLIDGVFTESPGGLERLTDPATKSSLVVSTPSPPLVGNGPAFERSAQIVDDGSLIHAWTWLTQPFVMLASRETTWQRSLALLLSGVWMIAVWALFGGAISRTAAVYLTRGEIIGPFVALRKALVNWGATAGAPFVALLGAAMLAVPLVLDGLFLRLDLVAMLGGLLWVLVLAWGALLAVVLVGLLVGWPLMWATVSVEGTDAFDGVSRCYAYTYQKPLHLVFYIFVAACLGVLGEFAVQFFAHAAVVLSEWTISWGAGNVRTGELVEVAVAEMPSDLSKTVAIGARSVQFWKWTLQAMVSSFSVGYLWCSAVGIYLLLRLHIDSTQIDQIAFDLGDPQKGLPNLADDESGVPEVERDTDKSPNDKADAGDR